MRRAGGKSGGKGLTQEHDRTSRSCYSFCPRLCLPTNSSCGVLLAVGLWQNQRHCQSRGVWLGAVL